MEVKQVPGSILSSYPILSPYPIYSIGNCVKLWRDEITNLTLIFRYSINQTLLLAYASHQNWPVCVKGR